jgi:16S rRNA (guanine527-N7)-methyltransferase
LLKGPTPSLKIFKEKQWAKGEARPLLPNSSEILGFPMPTLSESAIAELLRPYLPNIPPGLCAQLSTYLDLLLKWNARTNLTAIRDPEEIVRRHFGESLFAARQLDPGTSTLLDFGSGAGFPGLPIALLRPEITVTLAESQNKKATFLREVIRTLNLATEVWSNRVEAMPAPRRFDVVAMRAVDDMETALPAAISRITPGGQLAVLTTKANTPAGARSIPLPNSQLGVLCLQTMPK